MAIDSQTEVLALKIFVGYIPLLFFRLKVKYNGNRSHVIETQGGLEALPMIQRVKVRANFLRCKQNLVIIQGKSQVFTWLLLRFGSLL